MPNGRVKYKVLVYENGTCEVTGAENERLEMVMNEHRHNVAFPNVKVQPILEYDLGNPRVVCVCGHCWVVP